MKQIVCAMFLLLLLCGCNTTHILRISNDSNAEITNCVIAFGGSDEVHTIPHLSEPIDVSISPQQNVSVIITYQVGGKKYKVKWGCLEPGKSSTHIVRICGEKVGVDFVSIFGPGESLMPAEVCN